MGTYTVHDRQFFEAVYPDFAVSKACVSCHNSHPNSPKRDFKLNDVMGGIMLSFPMNDKTLLRVGVIGGVITALCCFTPVLVVLLGAVGLSAWVGWLDYVLLPALLIFVGITAYALFKREKA